MRFEDMDVWKRSSRLSVNIYQHLVDLKDFGFKDQITRSGLSIPSNIAEGFGRATDKDKRNFLNYANGSCAELRTQIYIGIEIGYIQKPVGQGRIQETDEISAMLSALMKYLKILKPVPDFTRAVKPKFAFD
ncbi:MAG: four helix bundle protein [Gammaproteobacteria bacterium]|nr:four helix bundle protein [Gammaproteobacteria bacterium]